MIPNMRVVLNCILASCEPKKLVQKHAAVAGLFFVFGFFS